MKNKCILSILLLPLPPSLCGASYLLSIIAASLADHLIWLPVEICVKE
jgi:hypothetical protein